MYKSIIKEIQGLPWHMFDPKEIIWISHVTAVEFAQSLRYAQEVHTSTELEEMIRGELKTNNLSYGDYNQIGDHHEFLSHFILKNPEIKDARILLCKAKNNYLSLMSKFSKEERAMTVFSREHELPGIFKSILNSHDWENLDLSYYKYYLERHIELDESEGGHGNLTEHFPLDEDVLRKFYRGRLALYKALET